MPGHAKRTSRFGTFPEPFSGDTKMHDDESAGIALPHRDAGNCAMEKWGRHFLTGLLCLLSSFAHSALTDIAAATDLTAAGRGNANIPAVRIDTTLALGKRSTSATKRGGTPTEQPAAAVVDLDFAALRQILGPGTEIRRSTPAQSRRLLAGLSQAQLENLQRLRDESADAENFVIAFDRRVVPSHLAARDLGRPTSVVLRSAAAPEHKMRAFLQDNRALLRLDDPDSELTLVAAETDKLGMTRLRYRQQYRGIPIWAAESFGHVNADNEIFLFQGGHLPTQNALDTAPTVTAEDAEARARASFSAATKLRVDTHELLVYEHPGSGRVHLAWHIAATADSFDPWHMFVDAHTGQILMRYSDLKRGAVQASGQSLAGAAVSFSAWQLGSGGYGMIDVTRPTDDRTTANPESGKGTGDVLIFNAADTTLDNIQRWSIAASASAVAGWPAAGVSAIDHVYRTLDYYKNVHGRNGIDGNGGSVMVAVNVKDGGPAYSSQANLVFLSSPQSGVLGNTAACFDISAHELTHGVVNFTANLEYVTQSGALNEHYADFFAVMAERTKWTVGNGCWLRNGGILRDLSDPARGDPPQPATMTQYQNLPLDQDHGGVHINGSIPAYAAYLAADGLTAKGIGTSLGKEKTEQIWYRALTSYLRRNSQFVDMRRATLQAAADLYGSTASEATTLENVWDTVGIMDTATGDPVMREPTDVTPASGEQQILFTYNQGIYIKTAVGTVGPINRYAAHTTRPAVYSVAAGTAVFYVTATGALQGIDLSAGTEQTIATSGIWAVTIAPDGGRLAYIPQGAGPYITILDLTGGTQASYRLTMPAMDSTAAFTSIVAPDVVAFDYTGNYVVFDALNEIAVPNLGTIDFWAIGILDVRDGNIVAPVPGQDPTLSIGNPNFAANNNYVLAWDVVDATTGESGVVLQNLKTGKTSGVNPDLNGLNRSALGRPSFVGDDSEMLIKTCYGSTATCPDEGYFATIPITKNGGAWTLNAAGASMIPANQAYGDFPAPFRKGGRTLTAALSLSAGSLSFGSVAVGASNSLDVTLTNSGDMDVTLTDISASGSSFAHNGVNGLLPHGQSMKIAVTFAPTQAGNASGTLTIKSDAGADKTVTLSGTASASVTTPSSAVTQTQTDCVFSWAERTYAELFVPAGATSKTLDKYYYRYYATTNSYIARDLVGDSLLYLGPLSGNQVLDVGALSGWVTQAGCQ